MDHRLELFIPILEILEIEVSNILYNLGNIGNLIFSSFYYPGNTGGVRAAPGVRLRGAWIIFGICSWKIRASWKYWKSDVYLFL